MRCRTAWLLGLLVAWPAGAQQYIITTVAGNGVQGYSGDGGPATSAQLNTATGVVVDSAGNIFIADKDNHRIRVAAGTGIITTVAGSGTSGYSGDGAAPTNARLNGPNGIALDSAGNLLIADSGNQRIRRVAAGAGIISTVAGSGTPGSSGDGGAATNAQLSSPEGIALDSAGNIFIADKDNDRIRRVAAGTGIITTVAAGLNYPRGIALDSAGNLFIADSGSHRIRRVAATTGIITTVAGGTQGYAGDGAPATNAQLNGPHGIAFDNAGNLFIADTDNHRIRRVAAGTGIITTVAGSGTPGYAGDGGAASDARLASPSGVRVDSAGSVFIADTGNHRIRRLSISGVAPIRVGETVSGNLTASSGRSVVCSGCYADLWQFTISTTQNLVITQSSSVFDSYLRVLDRGGTVIASDDDSGEFLNSLISQSFSAGSYRIEASTFSAGEAGPYSLLLTTLDPNIETASLPNATVGAGYSQTLRATGGAPPYAWRLESGLLPPGLSLNASTGVISGTPASAGTFRFRVRVTDNAGAFASREYTVAINNPTVSVETNSPLSGGVVGAGYSQALRATGGTPPYSWRLESGSLPPGLSLNASTGVISGTPRSAGTFTFQVRVTDNTGGFAIVSYTLTINDATVAVETASLPNATVGAGYSQTLRATGGTPPYFWRVESGSLPPGLSLNASTGVISGTPASAGTFTFLVRVNDNAGGFASVTYTVTINNLPVSTETASLPNGAVGAGYSQTLRATGGTPPYAWWVESGSLPPGLSLNASTGVISGTPASAGTFTFRARVTDNTGGFDNRQYTIVIAAPIPTVSLSGISATLNPLQQPTLQVNLSQSYADDVVGTVAATFAPDTVNPPGASTDLAFASGGRTANFTIPRGSTSTQIALQTGTVAGTITLSFTRLQVRGADVTPLPAPVTARINRTAPVITNTCYNPTASGFVVVVTGYSTPRQVTQASFRFTAPAGGRLDGTTPSLGEAQTLFTGWYGRPESSSFGSQFRLTVPFTVESGSIDSVGSAHVTLVNGSGSSPEAQATRQARCPGQ